MLDLIRDNNWLNSSMTEKRIAQRRRILKAGFIETSGGINCFVRNISETGASIEVSIHDSIREIAGQQERERVAAEETAFR